MSVSDELTKEFQHQINTEAHNDLCDVIKTKALFFKQLKLFNRYT